MVKIISNAFRALNSLIDLVSAVIVLTVAMLFLAGRVDISMVHGLWSTGIMITLH